MRDRRLVKGGKAFGPGPHDEEGRFERGMNGFVWKKKLIHKKRSEVPPDLNHF